MPARFIQCCPTCDRRLHIDRDYIDQSVTCQHCHARLIARDPSHTQEEWGAVLLRRADELLARVSQRPEFA